MWQDLGLFFRHWLQHPLQAGAVSPSSHALAAAMAAQVPDGGEGIVVELGAGTGAITRALLERGVPARRLVLVENDGGLCRLLRQRYPALEVIDGDAARLGTLLRARGVERVSAVVSGLPLLAMPQPLRRAILRQGRALLPPGAPFVQFSYGPFSPLRRCACHWHGRRVRHVLGNLPPASVWVYHRPLRGRLSCCGLSAAGC